MFMVATERCAMRYAILISLLLVGFGQDPFDGVDTSQAPDRIDIQQYSDHRVETHWWGRCFRSYTIPNEY